MFKKLLANLPFNPGLIDQVTFYGQRMKRDASIRRLGFAFIGLGFIVQLAAAAYPAQNSLAASSNDVLNGITNKNSILSAWDNNTGNIQGIYGKFGITRQNIANIPGQQPNATVVSSASNNYWSIGRHTLDSFGIDGSKWDERRVNIPGNEHVYERPLHAWDTYSSSKYAAFHGKNQYGVSFWILQTCGNPTFVGSYLPKPPVPKLEVHKTLLTAATVHRGDTVKFRLEYQNTVDDSLATNFKLTDTLDSHFTFVSLGYLSSQSGNNLIIDHGGNLGATDNPHKTTLVVTVKDNVANGTRICNAAHASSSQSSATSERPCVTVVVPGNTPPGAPPTPSGSCIASTKKESGTSHDFTVRTSAYVTNAKITGYDYYLDGSSAKYAHDQIGETPHDKKITGLGAGSHEVQVRVDILGSNNQNIQTPACVAQINIAENPRVNLSKSVSNVTQNINDANSTKASGGDILQFKLTTQNVTSTDYLNYDGLDYFGNVLQYADIVDPGQLSGQGISLDAKNNLRWHTPVIKANESDVKTINVRVKSDIPATNSPSTLSPDYNCSINNTYGDQVTVSVDCSTVKTIAQTASELPNTGAGSTIVIGAIVASVAGYLFMRSRIMAEEMEIVRQDYISSGGQ
jgi:fimbrial isopeptide formation D2 family protein